MSTVLHTKYTPVNMFAVESCKKSGEWSSCEYDDQTGAVGLLGDGVWVRLAIRGGADADYPSTRASDGRVLPTGKVPPGSVSRLRWEGIRRVQPGARPGAVGQWSEPVEADPYLRVPLGASASGLL